jgi:Flp pilus assembly protein CpaB
MFAALRARVGRIGRWPRLLVAGTCLLLALGAKPARRPAAAGVPVVVAAVDLPAGHRLTGRDLMVVRVPEAIRPAGARAGPGPLLGSRLAGPIGAHEPITGDRLVGAGLARGLPSGLVAAPVAIADAHVAELIRRGDHIDVLETARPPEVTDGTAMPATPRVSTAAHAALVLAVLPAQDDAGPELILAVDRPTLARLTRDSASHVFTPVLDSS